MKNVSKTSTSKTAQKVVKKVAEKKQFKSSLYTENFYSDCLEDKRKQQSTRGKARKQNKKFYDSIFLTSDKKGIRSKNELTKLKDDKDFKSLITEFVKRYKSNYVLNDYSIESFYKGSDDTTKKELTKVLEFVKEFISKKPTTKKPTIKKKVVVKVAELKEAIKEA